jgi:hypothetical protein
MRFSPEKPAKGDARQRIKQGLMTEEESQAAIQYMREQRCDWETALDDLYLQPAGAAK